MFGRLLDDPRLQIEKKDWILCIPNNLIAQTSAFFTLLAVVEMQHLSVSSISRFISHISIELLSSRLWSSICRRLLLLVSPSIDNPRLTILTDTDLRLD
jgi:hypothetical protein